MTLMTDLADSDFEQLVLCRDPGAGLASVIAVHDTTLGPSLGGVRMRSYPDPDFAVADAMNLAEAMTYKAALAGLPLGGGKSVIDADPTRPDRDVLLAAHARYIGTLGGRYLPSVDMGTTPRDLEYMSRWLPGRRGKAADPSPSTARGVVRAMEAAARSTGADGLRGLRVAVQGLGNVGRHVVSLLYRAGATTLVADIDDVRIRHARDLYGAQPVSVEDILTADVDVLCPCAAGGVVTERLAETMPAWILVGAANNLLAHDSLAGALAARDIVHVPDFVANAGGLMAAEADLREDDSGLDAAVDGIAATTEAVLRRAAGSGLDPVTVAVQMAREVLAARRADRPHIP